MGPITASLVRDLFVYDPETGAFTRRVANRKWKAGSAVGSVNAAGYIQTTISGQRVYLHRVAVLYMTGEWPADQVDHIDGNRGRNVWANLRCATHRLNQQNRRKSRADRKHGTLMGVKKHRRRWKARINDLHLGSFVTEQEAHAAYVEAKRRMHEGCTL